VEYWRRAENAVIDAIGSHDFCSCASGCERPVGDRGHGCLARSGCEDGEAVLGYARKLADNWQPRSDGWNGFQTVFHTALRGLGGLDIALCR